MGCVTKCGTFLIRRQVNTCQTYKFENVFSYENHLAKTLADKNPNAVCNEVKGRKFDNYQRLRHELWGQNYLLRQ